MDLKQIYREIVNEHNLHPGHKDEMSAPKIRRRGSNPTCGDDITVSLDLDENGIITDAAFQGEGCAVSQASTDICLDMIIGKTKDEALSLVETFMDMVHGKASEEQIESLEEAASLQDVAHMPARVKCATLAWHTLEKMLKEGGDE
ncbi:MAG: SUF system NifU family Fe-S cluster assembly protein [Lachnospiraceae bacterium]|nr:SUF system NifU family Fe-S cluster assembly protein [Lachnospiraceae bacterium]